MSWKVRINPSYEWSKEATELGISHRELEVLALVAEGFENKEIGDILHIKHQSVKNHRHSLAKKLRAKNIGQALVVALAWNLVSLEARAGEVEMKLEQARMVESLRKLIDGEKVPPVMKEKDRRRVKAFLLSHGINVDGTKSRLESGGGSNLEGVE